MTFIRGKKFVDSPTEKVEDGQGPTFQIIYTPKEQWDAYKRNAKWAKLLSVTSLIVSLLAVAIAFFSVQTPNLPH